MYKKNLSEMDIAYKIDSPLTAQNFVSWGLGGVVILLYFVM